MIKIYFLLALAASVYAAWTTPTILSEDNTDPTFPEIYIDPLTKITHAIWIHEELGNFALAYRQISYNKTLSPIIFLETSRRPRLSHIMGAGDGQRIFITYDAKRVKDDKATCGGGISAGCYEIFFTESKNGGLTWSKPAMIEHDEPADVVDRKGPRMIYVPETKQVFITYWRSGPMAYSTRIGDTSLFSKEAIYPFSSSTAYQSISLTYNEKNMQPIFHFVYVNWSYPEENMMYTQSVDLGRTWTIPKQLVFYKHISTSDSFFRPFTAYDHSTMKSSLFITFVLNNKAHVIWSTDNGNSWSIPLSVHSGSYTAIAPRIQLCRNVKGELPRVYVLYAVNKKYSESFYVFGSLDLKNYIYKEEETPFEEINHSWDYMISCYEDGRKMTVQAIVGSEDDEGMLKIYLSYNDKPRSLIYGN